MNVIITCLVLAAVALVFFSEPVSFVNGWGTHHGDNKPTEKGCKKAKTLKDYARLVDDMECKGEPELKDFIQQYGSSMNDDQKDCIKHRADLGNELYEDEIMKCYKKHD